MSDDAGRPTERPAAGPPDDPLIGRTLGGTYRLTGRLGAGAAGTVYVATHRLLGEEFAVKVLHPGLADDPDLRRGLLKEARAATLFAHRHAVQVRHCGEDEGVLFLAMDLCRGETLQRLLEREGALPEERAVRIALQVLDALGEAHRAGLVHRDLKPGNIVVDRDADGRDRVRVLDFGLARIVPAARGRMMDVLQSVEGQVVGTVAYMAPEQIRAVPDVDGRADLFSLGVTLHEMLAGRLPFRGGDVFSVVLRILESEPDPLPDPPERAASPALRAVLARALAKDRTQRFATAEEFADALRAAVSGTAPPPLPAPPTARSPTRSRRRAFALAGAAGLALLAFGIWFAFGRGGTGSTSNDAPAGERAREALHRGNAAEAVALLTPSEEAGTASGEDLLVLARARTEANDPNAGRTLERAERLLPPGDARVPAARGRHLWRVAGKFREARDELGKALALDRRFDDAREERVRMWLDARARSAFAGDGEDPLALAEGDVRAFETREPEDPRGPLLRAHWLLARAGEPRPEAVADFLAAVEAGREAARLDPLSAEGLDVAAHAFSRLAAVARTQGDHPAARARHAEVDEVLTEAIARTKAHPEHRLQGTLRISLHRHRNHARVHLEDADGMEEDAREIQALLAPGVQRLIDEAEAYRATGQWAEAARAFEVLRDVAPDRTVLFHVAFSYQMLAAEAFLEGRRADGLSRTDEAIRAYDAARLVAPESHPVLSYRGQCHLAIAMWDPDRREAALPRAKEDLDAALKLELDDPPKETLFRRCEYLAFVGDVDGALADIRRAIGVAKDRNPAFYHRLARCLLAKAARDAEAGRAEPSRAAIDEAVELAKGIRLQSPSSEPSAWRLQGLALLLRGSYAEAATCFSESLRGETLARSLDESRVLAAESLLLAKSVPGTGSEDSDAPVHAARRAREAAVASGRWTLPPGYFAAVARAFEAAGDSENARRARSLPPLLPP